MSEGRAQAVFETVVDSPQPADAPTRQGDADGSWRSMLAGRRRPVTGSRCRPRGIAALVPWQRRLLDGASRVSCTPGFVCAVAPGGGCCG